MNAFTASFKSFLLHVDGTAGPITPVGANPVIQVYNVTEDAYYVLDSNVTVNTSAQFVNTLITGGGGFGSMWTIGDQISIVAFIPNTNPQFTFSTSVISVRDS